MTETWKSAVGYEGIYEVSDAGNIRRVAKYLNSKDTPLRPSVVSGYHRVTLCRDNKTKQMLVHRAVADAFLGLGADMVVNHKNGNRLDNRLSNIEVVSRAENEQHKWRTLKTGTRNNVKITRAIADQIRSLYGPQWPYSKLAQQFGLNKSTIGDIVLGRTWCD